MITSSNKLKLRLFALVLSVSCLFFFYHSILLNTSLYVFDIEGDGLRCWYLSYYHIHDPINYSEFGGLNYPFKESLEFIDPQPIVNTFLKWFNFNIYPIKNQFVTITFLSVFIMLPITVILLLEILFMYGMVSWLSVFFSVCIAFMNPQLYRIYTHVTLAYMMFIPLAWFLLLKYQTTKKTKYLVFNFLLLLLVGFINPYYTALIALLILVLIIFNKKLQNKLIVYCVVLPLIFYTFLAKFLFNSAKEDINSLPYGAFGEAYRCRPEDVFFPTQGFWNNNFNLKWIYHSTWEGTAFIGWALWIAIVWFVFSFFYSIFKKKKSKLFNPFTTITGLFVAAVLLLIFSSGLLHFILPTSLKLSFPSFITNFRVYGRMSWVIFYLLSIFLAIKTFQLIRILSIQKKMFIKFVLLFFVVGFYFIDVYDMNINVANNIEKRKWENLDMSIDELAKKINFNSYQAIIALPYFHCLSGIEEERGPIDGLMWPTFYLSAYSMLPITNNFSSRTSQQIAKRQTQFYTTGVNTVYKEFKNKKPFLVITTAEGKKRIDEGTTDKSLLYKNEKKIFNECKLICNNDKYFIYSLNFDSLFSKSF